MDQQVARGRLDRGGGNCRGHPARHQRHHAVGHGPHFDVTGGTPGGDWDLLTATNVALPLANWITIQSGLFDLLGTASITNGVNFTEPQRYFRISSP